VRLLLDQNLSHRLITGLADLFPGSSHVRDLGLSRADDLAIWHAANASKDGDFHQMSLLHGAPPKVVWMRVGNASTDEIEHLMRTNADSIEAFVNGEGSLMIIDP
jgi:predicted nuclease of predicted toxin-antitoxin system